MTHLESRARAVSLLDSGEQRYTKAINHNNDQSRGPRKGLEDVSLVEFRCLVFTRIPVESYRRLFRSVLLYLCYVFRALINSLSCSFSRSKASTATTSSGHQVTEVIHDKYSVTVGKQNRSVTSIRSYTYNTYTERVSRKNDSPVVH